MSYDDNNPFAKILRGEIPCDKIAENDNALAFRDINPQAAQHALVIPKGEYASFSDFAANASPDEMADFVGLIKTTAAHMGVEDTGYRLIVNNGKDARQEVPHLHIHIVGGEDLQNMLPAKDKK